MEIRNSLRYLFATFIYVSLTSSLLSSNDDTAEPQNFKLEAEIFYQDNDAESEIIIETTDKSLGVGMTQKGFTLFHQANCPNISVVSFDENGNQIAERNVDAKVSRNIYFFGQTETVVSLKTDEENNTTFPPNTSHKFQIKHFLFDASDFADLVMLKAFGPRALNIVTNSKLFEANGLKIKIKPVLSSNPIEDNTKDKDVGELPSEQIENNE